MHSNGLTDDQITELDKNGYLVVENFLSADQCDELRKECMKIVDDCDVKEHQACFDTINQQHMKLKDDYFLTSGDKIRFFWEPKAQNEDGTLNRPKMESLNKVGHALHALNPVFAKATFDERLKGIYKQLGFIRPVILQSMYIFKVPKIGGEVNRHIDATFLDSDPLKLLGVWIALEDAEEDNGCLHFSPGSHKTTEVTYKMVRNPDPEAAPNTIFEGEPFDHAWENFKPTPVKKGSLVLIDGKVFHWSSPNNSERSRHVYTFHCTESYKSKWSDRNWLQPSPALEFTPLFDDSKRI